MRSQNNTNEHLIDELNQPLHRIIDPGQLKDKRKQTEEAYRELLEELVEERTAKLRNANKQLQQEITEHKQAEETLRKSEERYRTILEIIEEGYFEVDIAGNFTFVNDREASFLGYPKEELIGMNNRQYTDQETSKKLFQVFSKVYITGEPAKELDIEVIKKDGTKGFIEIWVYLKKDSAGQPTGFRGIARDITERKRAEKALEDSAKRYREVVESATEIIYTVDVKGNFTYANPAGLKVTGYSQAELQKLNYVDLVLPEHRERAMEIYVKQFREKLSMTYVEFPFFSKRGEIIWFGQNSTLVVESDRIIGFHIIARDITQRKKAEEALQKSENGYRILAENVTDMIWTADMNLRFTYISPSVTRMLGYSVTEAMSQTVEETLTPSSFEVAMEVFAEELAKEQSDGKDLFRSRTLELEENCKDGSTVWTESTMTFLRELDGRPVGILGITRDITERKKHEQEKTNLEEQLRQSQKMEAIGQLAGGVAHDFNNLLTVIKGYSQLSLNEMKENDPLRESIEEVRNAADRAADLTRKLLAFSCRQVLEMKVLDLNTVLRDLERMLRRLIGEDIELVTILTDGLGRVKTDPGWVEQIIMNLAVNARDAMPNGGKLTIETANVELDGAYAHKHIDVTPGRYVMLSMSDTGMGMTPEVRKQVFEPFFTTKEKGKGTGLGLSTVYGIVKQSGGNIWVYSEPGLGTTFKIYLPRADESIEEVREKVTGEEVSRGCETILLVEDEESVRRLTVEILKRQGYEVLEASCGDDALVLSKGHKEPIHIMLTDVVMPGMSGRELANQLKPFHPKMKVLYMSGYTDNTIINHGILNEGINYIQKPFTVDGLTKRVREVLDKVGDRSYESLR
ncbi:MAG TPA: PAS domain S-box protein [Thermodesulfobacteriota bacterium]|nr:PAS domain S-box protein [Thermodesulfobacteriota bacterium]